MNMNDELQAMVNWLHIRCPLWLVGVAFLAGCVASHF